MGKEAELRDALAEHAARFGPAQTVMYQVVSLDEEAMTCEVVDEDDIEYLIRLTPIVTAGQSILQYPKEGKHILAGRLEDSGDWYISWAEQWKKIVYTIGDCVLETDGIKWTIKNGSANLLDIISKIIQAVQVITVLVGNSPDYAKLIEAQIELNNLLQ